MSEGQQEDYKSLCDAVAKISAYPSTDLMQSHQNSSSINKLIRVYCAWYNIEIMGVDMIKKEAKK